MNWCRARPRLTLALCVPPVHWPATRQLVLFLQPSLSCFEARPILTCIIASLTSHNLQGLATCPHLPSRSGIDRPTQHASPGDRRRLDTLGAASPRSRTIATRHKPARGCATCIANCLAPASARWRNGTCPSTPPVAGAATTTISPDDHERPLLIIETRENAHTLCAPPARRSHPPASSRVLATSHLHPACIPFAVPACLLSCIA